jgi:hypothetical protein
MGRPKRKRRTVYVEPYYSPYYTQLKEFETAPQVDVTAMIEAITGKQQSVISAINKMREQHLKTLTGAIMSAIGSLTYNPYEKILSSSFEKMAQQKVQPLQEIQKIYTEQAKTAGMPLRTAGAYVALPTPEKLPTALKTEIRYDTVYYGDYPEQVAVEVPLETPEPKPEDVAQYEQYLPSYQKAFEQARDFLLTTKNTLANLGFTETEIRQAMTPFVSAMREGLKSSLAIGGTLKPEYESFAKEWGLI